jgi:hypothetical protein
LFYLPLISLKFPLFAPAKNVTMNNKRLALTGLSLFFACFLQAQSMAITLKAEKAAAKTGETVCLTISAAQFTKMLSTQYTLRWDPKVLEFKELKSFKLPFLSKENFGLQNVKGGVMPIVWIENNLKGATLADNAMMYEVCFVVKGKAGSKSDLSFSQNPTPFEAINLNEKAAKITVVNGGVTVK